MYYSAGNYEALSCIEKPRNVDVKSAYIIGSGLAGLSAAAFLLRDGKLKGERIHIIENDSIPGAACEGLEYAQGFVIRSCSAMEEHFECFWNLFSSIPSLEQEGLSVLDEFRLLNKKDPNHCLIRATKNRGEDAHLDGKYNLTNDALKSLFDLVLTPDEGLFDKKISDVMDPSFFNSNLWLYFQTLFSFSSWHSALEMKRYFLRFVHQAGGIPDFSGLKYSKYNQYESFILPLATYLEKNGVDFIYNTKVLDIKFEFKNDKKRAKYLVLESNGLVDSVGLSDDDLLFITNGSSYDGSIIGSQNKATGITSDNSSYLKSNLWKEIESQSDEFGKSEKFFSNPELTNWEAATITTLDDKIPRYIEKISKRDPFSGKVVTGGVVTILDSSWLISYTFNRQPHFKSQPRNQLVGWINCLNTDKEGDFIHKKVRDCTGSEICAEWLYHMGVEDDLIMDLAENSANTVPVMLPYITSSLMPRETQDRPLVVLKDATNFAFIGQFAETSRDTVFTTEYSVRTAMEAVYTLLSIDKAVPEVWASAYDVRTILSAASALLDGRKLKDVDLQFIDNKLIGSMKGTTFYNLLESFNLV